MTPTPPLVGRVVPLSGIRMTRAEFNRLIHRKPSKGYLMARKRKKVKDAARLIADKKWSAAVKEKAGLRCEKCNKFGKGLAAHHIFSRSLKSVRHYLPNGCCLCNGHHWWAHRYPHDFKDWITLKRGVGWWYSLQEKANTRHVRYTAADEPEAKAEGKGANR